MELLRGGGLEEALPESSFADADVEVDVENVDVEEEKEEEENGVENGVEDEGRAALANKVPAFARSGPRGTTTFRTARWSIARRCTPTFNPKIPSTGAA